jgi:hypothetical protein
MKVPFSGSETDDSDPHAVAGTGEHSALDNGPIVIAAPARIDSNRSGNGDAADQAGRRLYFVI